MFKYIYSNNDINGIIKDLTVDDDKWELLSVLSRLGKAHKGDCGVDAILSVIMSWKVNYPM